MSSMTAPCVSFLIAAAVAWTAACAPIAASAQQSTPQPSSTVPASIPGGVTDKLANDLARLQAGIQATQQLAASSGAWKQLQVTSENANVLNGADPSASMDFVAKKGEKLYVLDRANDFYAVAADNGKTGWITAGDVKPIVGSVKAGYKPDSFSGSDLVSQWNWTPTSAVQNTSPQGDASVTARIFKALTEQAVEFRDSYKDNKYMYVSGFTVHVGIPPSVDLAFTFR